LVTVYNTVRGQQIDHAQHVHDIKTRNERTNLCLALERHILLICSSIRFSQNITNY